MGSPSGRQETPAGLAGRLRLDGWCGKLGADVASVHGRRRGAGAIALGCERLPREYAIREAMPPRNADGHVRKLLPVSVWWWLVCRML